MVLLTRAITHVYVRSPELTHLTTRPDDSHGLEAGTWACRTSNGFQSANPPWAQKAESQELTLGDLMH